MHRSGTSCVTGMIEEQGVFLGEVNRRIRDNPRGNRENVRIIKLHDKVLSYNASSWKNPPGEKIRFEDAHRQERDEILKGYRGKDPCAFKDPRTLVLLDFWRDVELDYIGVVRNPLSVMSSLGKRLLWVSKARGLKMWKVYNRRLLDLRSEIRFPIINFDDKDSLNAQVAEALKFYGISSDRPFTFFDSSIPRSEVTNSWKDAIRDGEAQEIWDELRGQVCS